jgi:hypothetical protein
MQELFLWKLRFVIDLEDFYNFPVQGTESEIRGLNSNKSITYVLFLEVIPEKCSHSLVRILCVSWAVGRLIVGVLELMSRVRINLYIHRLTY